MYDKIKLVKVRFYDYEKECWFDCKACLESDVKALVNKLEKEICEERTQWNALRQSYQARRRKLREQISQFYKKCELQKIALKKLRVAFANVMSNVWEKEGELCDHEQVSNEQAYKLSRYWEGIKEILKKQVSK